jgi:putative FmdB family regulatory protein
MPTYQYQCRDCGHGFDQYQKFSDDPLTECPACGGLVRRVIQNVGVVFKGSGWYINDSRKPAATQGDASAPAAKSGSGDASAKSGTDATKAKDTVASAESGSTSKKASAPTTS